MSYEPRMKIDISSPREEEQIFADEAITDILAHTSSIANCVGFGLFTVFVDNGLDQQVSVQVMGNRVNSTSGAVTIGASFSVAANDQEARTIDPTDEGYLPYIYLVVTAAVAPTAGVLNAYVIKRAMI